jgi:hypothetical protein
LAPLLPLRFAIGLRLSCPCVTLTWFATSSLLESLVKAPVPVILHKALVPLSGGARMILTHDSLNTS